MSRSEVQAIELEIVTETDAKLVKYASSSGLEKPQTETLVEAFRPIFAKARAAIGDARGVAESVKDATCVTEIKKSRACRLALRAIRIESEATRKKQKEHALLYGRAVDGFHNILLADLQPVETALQDAEDIAERAEAARKAALKSAREAELFPLLETPLLVDVGDLTQQTYDQFLADAKLLRQARIDAAAKAEAERKAREEQARKDREENERLKVEVAKREAAAKAEREAAEKKLAAERAAAEAAAKAAAEKARKEREAIEAKARAERAAAEAAARKEQQRLEAIAAEERKKVVAAEAKAKALRDAEAKRVADAAAAVAEKKKLAEVAAKKAAAAPDNAKAQAFADLLRKMPLPKFNSHAWAQLPNKVNALADWIESQITKL